MRHAPERMLSIITGITLAGIILIIGWKKVEPIANIVFLVALISAMVCRAASWIIQRQQGVPERTLRIISSNLSTVAFVIFAWAAVSLFAIGILPVLFSLGALFYYTNRLTGGLRR